MKRRTFLHSLSALVGLPLVTPAQQQPEPTPRYSDSENHSQAQLTRLHDGRRTTGITYQP